MRNDWNAKVYFMGRKSLGMKNFIFKSQDKPFDLQKFSRKLEVMQQEMRHQRDDLTDIKRRLTRIITIMTDHTTVEREEEYPEEELGTTKDSRDGD